MQLSVCFVLLAFFHAVSCQQIWDVVSVLSMSKSHCNDSHCVVLKQWQTTWDRQKLLTYSQPSPGPINFVPPGPTGSADIVVNDAAVYQTIYGFGGSLSKLGSFKQPYLCSDES